jgi:hypothetical protein
MEKTKFNLRESLQRVVQIGLGALVSFGSLSHLRMEAQIYNLTSGAKYDYSFNSSKGPGKCFSSVGHTISSFSEKNIPKTIVRIPKNGTSKPLSSLVGISPKIFLEKGSDGLIICPQWVKNEEIQSIKESLPDIKKYRQMIQKNPLAYLYTSSAVPLVDKNENIYDLGDKLPNRVLGLKPADYSNYSKTVVKQKVCILPITARNIANLSGQKLPKRLRPDSFYAMFERNKYSLNSNNKFISVPSVAPGVSGSGVRLGKQTIANLSEVILETKAKTFKEETISKANLLKEFREVPAVNKAIDLCYKHGFPKNSSDYDFGRISPITKNRFETRIKP